MLLFKDVISGDEMCSDAFKIIEIDDIAYEVDCKMITIKEGAVDIGGNPSAEGGDDDDGPLEEGSVSVNNVVYSFRLTSTSFDKKSYMSYIKGYMKSLKTYLAENNADRVAIFEKQVQPFVKKILENFKDYEFYVGETMNPDGMVALLNYREDGTTPYLTFFKDGLKGEKLVIYRMSNGRPSSADDDDDDGSEWDRVNQSAAISNTLTSSPSSSNLPSLTSNASSSASSVVAAAAAAAPPSSSFLRVQSSPLSLSGGIGAADGHDLDQKVSRLFLQQQPQQRLPQGTDPFVHGGGGRSRRFGSGSLIPPRHSDLYPSDASESQQLQNRTLRSLSSPLHHARQASSASPSSASAFLFEPYDDNRRRSNPLGSPLQSPTASAHSHLTPRTSNNSITMVDGGSTRLESALNTPLSASYGRSLLSPLTIPSPDHSRNIWGAPDLQLVPSVYDRLNRGRGLSSSSTADSGGNVLPSGADTAFPSKLLFTDSEDERSPSSSRYGGAIYSDLDPGSPSRLRGFSASSTTSSNFSSHQDWFDRQHQYQQQQRLNSKVSPSGDDLLADPLSAGAAAGTGQDPFNLRSLSNSELAALAVRMGLGSLLSPSGTSGNATASGAAAGTNGVMSNSIGNPLAGSPYYGVPMIGLEPSLPIVREIQGSKLRVDETKLTREYFETLTKEARDIIAESLPGPEEVRMQRVVFDTVQDIAKRVFPSSAVHLIGSAANGFALAGCDLDICICITNYDPVKMSYAQCVERLGHSLKQAGMKDVKMLTRAKVPIAKMRDPVSGIRCDIGFQNNLGIYNTRLLKTYSQIDRRLHELVIIAKVWCKRRAINEPYFGSLSSYCYTLMVIHLLQLRGVLPCLQQICPDGSRARVAKENEVLKPGTAGVPPIVEVDGFDVYFYEDLSRLPTFWKTTSEESLGELIFAFFKYYAVEFPYVQGVVSIRTAHVLNKEDKGWTKERQQELNRNGGVKDRFWLCIEDPFDLSSNVGKPVDKESLFQIRGEFIRASKYLCARTVGENNVLSKIFEKLPAPTKKPASPGLTPKKF